MIYPNKPKAQLSEAKVTAANAFVAVRKFALGETNFETACASLGVQGPQFMKYAEKYKLLVDQVKDAMIKNKGAADKAALLSAINVTDPHGFKENIVDDLLDRETVEGTLAAFAAKYSA